MAVTKRMRFEVLRRDKFQCQYCGAKPPEAELHIDHVTPVALGGTDKPNNLVTACRDCNTGKASIQPDSPLVEAVSEKAQAYALAMRDHMTRFRASIEEFGDYEQEFLAEWRSWTSTATKNHVPLPPDYKLSLFQWMRLGIPHEVFQLAIPKAMVKDKLRGEFGRFSYMAGIVTNMARLDEIDLDTSVAEPAVYTAAEAEDYAEMSYSHGHDAGARRARAADYLCDPLRRHIDRAVPIGEG